MLVQIDLYKLSKFKTCTLTASKATECTMNAIVFYNNKMSKNKKYVLRSLAFFEYIYNVFNLLYLPYFEIQ